MGIEVIYTGGSPNDGTGDSLRTSFIKSNNNFSYLNSVVSGNGIVSANSLTITGNVFLGQSLTFSPAGAALQYGQTANAYVQMVIQNKSSLNQASSDYVVTADNGNDSSYFGDFGIASSTYYYPGYTSILPNDTYLIANGGHLLLNAGTPNKTIKFVVGGSNTTDVVGQISNTAVSFTQNTISTSSTTGALKIAGGTGIAGDLNVGGYTSVAGGLMAAGTFAGSYTDGIIVDYLTGNGRVTVGTADGINFYNGGLAPSILMSISSTGNVVATGTISTIANISSGNLVFTGGNTVIASSNVSGGFSLDGIKATSYRISNNFGTNANVVTPNLTISGGVARTFYDINANVTVTIGGTITTGVEKHVVFRNKASTTANIILPNSNNNKGSNVIPVAGNVTAHIWMLATDTTLANVVMTVVND